MCHVEKNRPLYPVIWLHGYSSRQTLFLMRLLQKKLCLPVVYQKKRGKDKKTLPQKLPNGLPINRYILGQTNIFEVYHQSYQVYGQSPCLPCYHSMSVTF